jgi:phage FluMu protein Com
VINANSYMSMICPRCQNVFSILNSTLVPIRSAHFYISTQVPKRKNVPGMKEAFVGMDQTVVTSTRSEYYVWIISPVFARKGQTVDTFILSLII